MKNIILFTILSLNIALAQYPGYMGKKNLLTVDFLSYPALGDYFNFKYYDSSLKPGVNFRYGAHIERVISRNHSLLIGCQFFNTRKVYLYPDISVPKAYSIGRLALATNVGYVAFRWYNHSAFGLPAPVGLYHQLSAFGMRYHVTDPDGLYPGRAGVDLRCWDGGLAYAVGMQRIFWNQLTVHGGLETGLPLGLMLSQFSLGGNVITLNDPEAKAAARVFFHSLFSLKIGIGWVF